MPGTVKRDYRSDLRTAQARDTRRAIVAAAATLFVEQGFGATTVDAVAKAAAVSRKTVFTAVGGKVELLKLALDWAIAGDDEPVALADRPDVARLIEHSDAATLLRGWAQTLAGIDRRVAGLFQALEVAAGLDSEAQLLYRRSQQQRLDGTRVIVDRIVELEALCSDLSTEEAVDIAWLASDPALYDRLVRHRRWSLTRFADWLSQMLLHQLLGVTAAPGSERRSETTST